MPFPRPLADAIETHISAVDRKELSTAVERVSARYRSPDFGQQAIQSPAERAAYLLTRMPATYAALVAVFREIRKRMPAYAPQSLLDLGAGPGTAAWAASETFGDLKQIVSIERDAAMLQIAGAFAGASASPAMYTSQWISTDLATFTSKQKFDLVVASYALGEVGEEQRPKTVEHAWNSVRGLLAIIEPGTPRGFETVLHARNQLIERGAHMVAPCPHEAICPMIERAGDWCHFAQRLERSAMHRRLKSGVLGYEDEKFSYVVFSRTPVAKANARIVRHPIHLKGHIKLELCAIGGLREQTVTRSDGESFRRARAAKWGEDWE